MRTLDGISLAFGGSVSRAHRLGAVPAKRLTTRIAGDAGPATPAGTTPALAPRAPLESSGHRRDDAGLLVAWKSDGRLVEATMADLADFLEPGDVLLVNTSATRPAALVVDNELVIHLSTELGEGTTPDGSAAQGRRLNGWDEHVSWWVVEPRRLRGNGSAPWLDFEAKQPIELPGGATIRLVAPYRPTRPLVRDTSGSGDVAASAALMTGKRPVRLWTAELRLPSSVDEYLARHGRPIRYGSDAGDWPIDAYQTVFANQPGSVEMPSAARGFTAELVTRLVSRGVIVAPLLLHTGVASQETGEAPYPERYHVPASTAAAVNHAKATGHRVVAVGTTATRAIESVAETDGHVWSGGGWTDLVITPDRGVRVIDGLLTGWHDPEASHLLLVEAVAGGPDILDRSYDLAAERGFAGHEFGDFHLLLP